MTFTIPVNEPGNYRIDALVTIAPGYGSFSTTVDQKEADISYPEITLTEERDYLSKPKTSMIFDAQKVYKDRENNGIENNIAGSYTVQRITLGTFETEADHFKVSLTSEDYTPEHSFLGIDQFIVTKKQ